MAFKLHYRDDGASAPIEYLPTAANAGFDLGKALTVDSATGLAVACDAAAKPVYISVGKEKDGVTPAMRVHPSMVLETAMPSGGTALKTGQKLTLSADAMGVTATTTSGVAEIVGKRSTSEGETILVRF